MAPAGHRSVADSGTKSAAGFAERCGGLSFLYLEQSQQMVRFHDRNSLVLVLHWIEDFVQYGGG